MNTSKISGDAAVRNKAINSFNKIFFLYLIVLIFEGCLRKWIFPSFQLALFFIRDPLVIYLYYQALKNGLWPSNTKLLDIGIYISFFSTVFFLLYSIFTDIDIKFLIYGLRNYFLYIPFPFLIYKYLDIKTLRKIVDTIILLSIPISILVVIQSILPSSHVLNAGIDESFTPLGGGVLRTQGTFTSILGQSFYISILWACLISALVDNGKFCSLNSLTLKVLLLPSLIILFVSGSRTAFVFVIVYLSVFLIYSLFFSKDIRFKQRSVIVILLISISSMIIISTKVLDFQLQTILERSQGAADDYGGTPGADMIDRVLFSFTSFTKILSTVPIYGYGLGYGGNAASTLEIVLPNEVSPRDLEEELARNIFELGPIFGGVYILYRLNLAFWILRRVCLLPTKSGSTLFPILLSSFSIYMLMIGFLTGNGIGGGFGWFFVGVSSASAKLIIDSKKQD